MIVKRAELIAVSRADDIALRSLADAAELLHDLEDSRIVGGQMVSILVTAFPTDGAVIRRTNDTDVAVSTAIAASDDLQERLARAEYEGESGNRFMRQTAHGTLILDILVPAAAERFESEELNGRGYDAAPGLSLALSMEPMSAHVGATLLDGTVVEFEARIPPVEAAIVIKSFAVASRRATKDVEDLYSLLHVANNFPTAEIGGWKLFDSPLKGTRLDAARILHGLADSARQSSSILARSQVRPEVFAALVRTLVAKP